MWGKELQISEVLPEEFPEVVEVWEAAVRATHHFLSPGDIEKFKPLILNNYLHLVTLACVRNAQGKISGFIGLSADKVEMLFVHPNHMGKGIGAKLMTHAIEKHKAKKVDVNEDNRQAVDFYLHLGFEIAGRSEFDPEGNPYPILHLVYRPSI